MQPVVPLNENEIKAFFKAATVPDVEVFFNSIIMTRKILDRSAGISREYFVQLTDNKPKGYTYEVTSNSIGQEALRVLCRKHNITNNGSESENSKFISFFSKEN